ncbi:6-hydroxymethylpterin diphosphokinase MptE-like [Moorella glycerini]|uniref:DUF115 domain-containing protein n=1 Tax=Neomoorella stamsii TaxID=1266720 RepID=A0A9X7J263_9FIRM|nr:MULTISPECIES: 6-hydroxymethylpterin diphosphokinase MptE-like protein [Moorella]PRR72305.1 hypothetical protein MOST_20160 [Moorella stamsii]CEP68884.1 6-hydroxymethylpterin diphosphokinase MptE-like [Moorella glycerini]
MDAPYLEINLKVLRSRCSGFIPFLNGQQDSERVKVELARNGSPTLLVNQEGQGFYIHIHSCYEPEVEAQRWLKSLAWEKSQLTIVLGFGLGYHLEAMLALYPELKIIVIEPDLEIFLNALAIRDLRHLLQNPNIEMILGADINSLAKQIFTIITNDLAAGLNILSWPPYLQLWGSFWQKSQQMLLNLIRQRLVNIATYKSFATQWLVNFFRNLPISINDPGIKSLFSLFINRPAIIVAAGPSLEKNIHLLHRARGAALIIAAGSAINPLLKNNIRPDLLVSFDPGEANYKHFTNLQRADIPLVYAPTIYSRITDEYRGPRFAMGMDVFPFTSWAFQMIGDDKGMVASGPSVANVAWDLARQMGCNPIIFVGQDLAYTNQKSHAEGVITAHRIEIDDQNQQDYFYTEDVFGERVLTNRPMYAMKVWFEQRIATFGHGRLFIDATEGGAKIAGTEIMPLAEVLEKYCGEQFDPYGHIMEVYRHQRSCLGASSLEQRLDQRLEEWKEQLSRLETIYQKAIKIARPLEIESATKRLNAQRYQEAAARLQRLDREMTSMAVYKNFIQPSIKHIIEAINFMSKELERESDLARKGDQLVKVYLSLFKVARDFGTEIKKLLIKKEARGLTS